MTAKNEVTIVLDLDELVRSARYVSYDEYGDTTQPAGLAEVVVEGIVQQIRRSAALREVDAEIKRRVGDIRDEEIRSAIRDLIPAMLDEATQPTDAFGSPKGQPRTFRELLVEEASKALKAPRDNYNNRGGLLQQVIKDEVERSFKAELKKEIDAAKAAASRAVREQAAQVITETITRMAGTS